MGTDAYYICDKCGTKLLLNHQQPSFGGFSGELLQKYCPVTGRVICISVDSIWFKANTIACLHDIAEPPKMPHIINYYSKYSWVKSMIWWLKKRFFIWKCKKRKCDGSCLVELQILKTGIGSKDAKEYKCPRPGCDGVMHIEPPGIYMYWD